MRDVQPCETRVDLMEYQCHRYPVYKNISHNWQFDYRAEERKRFRGVREWDPSILPPREVNRYLKSLFIQKIWQLSGLTEDIALKYLQCHDYRIDKALAETVEDATKLRRLIAEKQSTDERAELISWISSLTD